MRGLRNISTGTLVEPGDLTNTLDDNSVMKLDFAVPKVFLTDLKPGLAIEDKARASGERSLTGEIRSIDSRVVSVETLYSGAAANVVETRITRLSEDRVSGVEGIRTIESVSRERNFAPPFWRRPTCGCARSS